MRNLNSVSKLAILAVVGPTPAAFADPYAGVGFGSGNLEISGGLDDGFTEDLQGAVGLLGYSFPVGNGMFAAVEGDYHHMDGAAFDSNMHLRGLLGMNVGAIELFVAGGVVRATGGYPDFVELGESFPTGTSIGAGANIPVTDQVKARIEVLRDTYQGEAKFNELTVNMVRALAIFNF